VARRLRRRFHGRLTIVGAAKNSERPHVEQRDDFRVIESA
jgi:hypothetical protein